MKLCRNCIQIHNNVLSICFRLSEAFNYTPFLSIHDFFSFISFHLDVMQCGNVCSFLSFHSFRLRSSTFDGMIFTTDDADADVDDDDTVVQSDHHFWFGLFSSSNIFLER